MDRATQLRLQAAMDTACKAVFTKLHAGEIAPAQAMAELDELRQKFLADCEPLFAEVRNAPPIRK
jgi:hypothetical protein